MINQQGLKENTERQQYACNGRKKNLRQKIIERVNTPPGKDKDQEEKGAFAENSQKEDKVIKWLQVFNRWWVLILGNENRHRMATGELFLLLGILGASPKVMKKKNRRKKGASSFWFGFG